MWLKYWSLVDQVLSDVCRSRGNFGGHGSWHTVDMWYSADKCFMVKYLNSKFILSDCIIWDVDQVVIKWLAQVTKVSIMMLMIQTNTQNQARTDSPQGIWCNIICKLLISLFYFKNCCLYNVLHAIILEWMHNIIILTFAGTVVIFK